MADNETNTNGNSLPEDSESASCIDHNRVDLNDDVYETLQSTTEITNTILNQVNCCRAKVSGLIHSVPSSNPILNNAEADDINRSTESLEDPLATSGSVEPVVLPSPRTTTASNSEPRVSAPTTDNQLRASSQPSPPPHIMISYNHDTASVVCRAIYERLIGQGYNVWFDKDHLYGSVLDAMGEAVDNAYVVLLCINVRYSQSPFCLREAKYAVETRTPVIPCMMEENFRPRGGLGIIKCDLKHIEFFYEEQFDDNFETLINEINAIEVGLGMRTTRRNSFNFRTRFNEIISQDLLAIQNLHLHRGNLNERDFGRILYRLVQELSPETLRSFENDRSTADVGGENPESHNDRLIEHLLDNNGRDLEEWVRRHQQENENQTQRLFSEQSDRLKAFIDFQEQQNARFSQRQRDQQEQVSSLFQIQQQQQEHYANLEQQFTIQNETYRAVINSQQERNDRISERLIQHVEQLTELIVQQQEQHARHTASVNQMLNHVLEISSATEQQQQQRQQATYSFDFEMFNKIVPTILLFGTLFILLRKG